jgi:hypothetical protein
MHAAPPPRFTPASAFHTPFVQTADRQRALWPSARTRLLRKRSAAGSVPPFARMRLFRAQNQYSTERTATPHSAASASFSAPAWILMMHRHAHAHTQTADVSLDLARRGNGLQAGLVSQVSYTGTGTAIELECGTSVHGTQARTRQEQGPFHSMTRACVRVRACVYARGGIGMPGLASAQHSSRWVIARCTVGASLPGRSKGSTISSSRKPVKPE